MELKERTGYEALMEDLGVGPSPSLPAGWDAEEKSAFQASPSGVEGLPRFSRAEERLDPAAGLPSLSAPFDPASQKNWASVMREGDRAMLQGMYPTMIVNLLGSMAGGGAKPVGPRPGLRTYAMTPEPATQGWRSKMRDVVAEKMRGPMPTDRLEKTLLSAGVKPEEIQWTGMGEVFKRGGKVKPEDVPGAFGLEETTKGGKDKKGLPGNLVDLFREELRGEYDPVDFDVRDSQGVFDTAEYGERFEANAARRAIQRAQIGDFTISESGSPKFSNWQLPGGDNYREVLLQVPTKKGETAREIGNRLFGGDVSIYDRTPDQQHAIELAYQNEVTRGESMFRGSHWDEPNVLAHLRMNDRT